MTCKPIQFISRPHRSGHSHFVPPSPQSYNPHSTVFHSRVTVHGCHSGYSSNLSKEQKIIPDFIKQVIHFTNQPLVLLFKLEERKQSVSLEFTCLDSMNFLQPHPHPPTHPSPFFTKLLQNYHHHPKWTIWACTSVVNHCNASHCPPVMNQTQN